MRVAFRSVTAPALGVCVLLCGGHALAHPKVDEAQTRIETADFEAALRLLAEAEAGSELTREDALRLLELRALVHLALKEGDPALITLRRLAVLSPDHVFAPSTSPDLVAAFERARRGAPEPPQLVLERRLQPEGVLLTAHVRGDALNLVHDVVLYTRVDGRPWRSTPGLETIVAAAPGQRVEYRAQALGIGGAPLLSSSTQRLVMSEQKSEPAASPWLYAGIVGGALAIAGTVTALLLVDSEPTTTRVSPPSIVDR